MIRIWPAQNSSTSSHHHLDTGPRYGTKSCSWLSATVASATKPDGREGRQQRSPSCVPCASGSWARRGAAAVANDEVCRASPDCSQADRSCQGPIPPATAVPTSASSPLPPIPTSLTRSTSSYAQAPRRPTHAARAVTSPLPDALRQLDRADAELGGGVRRAEWGGGRNYPVRLITQNWR